MIAKLREAVRAAIPEDMSLPQIRHGTELLFAVASIKAKIGPECFLDNRTACHA